MPKDTRMEDQDRNLIDNLVHHGGLVGIIHATTQVIPQKPSEAASREPACIPSSIQTTAMQHRSSRVDGTNRSFPGDTFRRIETQRDTPSSSATKGSATREKKPAKLNALTHDGALSCRIFFSG